MRAIPGSSVRSLATAAADDKYADELIAHQFVTCSHLDTRRHIAESVTLHFVLQFI